jgi:hypothetical protein
MDKKDGIKKIMEILEEFFDKPDPEKIASSHRCRYLASEKIYNAIIPPVSFTEGGPESLNLAPWAASR